MKVDSSELFSQPISELKPAQPICVPSGTLLREALATMRQYRIGCILITADSKLAGILTERDVLLTEPEALVVAQQKPVDDFMTSSPESLPLHASIAFALNRMSLGGYRHVPLVDEYDGPVGIISVKDIVTYFVDNFPDDVMNLPPEPDTFPSSAEGA